MNRDSFLFLLTFSLEILHHEEKHTVNTTLVHSMKKEGCVGLEFVILIRVSGLNWLHLTKKIIATLLTCAPACLFSCCRALLLYFVLTVNGQNGRMKA